MHHWIKYVYLVVVFQLVMVSVEKQKKEWNWLENCILGAVLNTAKVEKGSRVAVFGLGAVGLAVIMVKI